MKTTIKQQNKLALEVLGYHGGQASNLYAVGSCMLSDTFKEKAYSPANHRGHDGEHGALAMAVRDLNHLSVIPAMGKRAAHIAKALSRFQ